MAKARQVWPASRLLHSAWIGSSAGAVMVASGVGGKPVVQLAHRVRHVQGLQHPERIGLMGAIAHPRARAARIDGHLQVVRGVADHERALGRHAEFAHELVQHARVRFARGLVRRARTVEHALQRHGVQHLVEPAAALARGHGQVIALGTKRFERLDHTLEQGRWYRLRGDVVIGVVLTKRYKFGIADLRIQGTNRLRQAQ
eukprot:gene16039-33710_t